MHRRCLIDIEGKTITFHYHLPAADEQEVSYQIPIAYHAGNKRYVLNEYALRSHPHDKSRHLVTG